MLVVKEIWRKFRGRGVIQRAPAVTLPVGDVSAAAGESFRVARLWRNGRDNLHFASDEDYYERMSRLAEERAEQLMDSKNSFCGVIDEWEQDMN